MTIKIFLNEVVAMTAGTSHTTTVLKSIKADILNAISGFDDDISVIKRIMLEALGSNQYEAELAELLDSTDRIRVGLNGICAYIEGIVEFHEGKVQIPPAFTVQVSIDNSATLTRLVNYTKSTIDDRARARWKVRQLEMTTQYLVTCRKYRNVPDPTHCSLAIFKDAVANHGDSLGAH